MTLALTEVSEQFTSILDINELLERVVRLVQQTFNYYHVGIGLVVGIFTTGLWCMKV